MMLFEKKKSVSLKLNHSNFLYLTAQSSVYLVCFVFLKLKYHEEYEGIPGQSTDRG